MSDEPRSGEGATDADASDASGGERERPARTGWRRMVPTWRMLVGGFLLCVLLVSGALVIGYLVVPIPEPNANATRQSNVYLYADGTQIAKDGDVNREIVPLSRVPEETQRAVLAAEDRDFYDGSAVDPAAMARAAWNMLRGEGKQSGSTITQQYVKNYYLSQERTLTRKAEEFFIAMKLDREVSKNDILEGYLNTSYFGRNAYGIQAAAHAYYGKDVDDLTTPEGAYLAALVNSPSTYDVVANPENTERAIARWDYVLDGMVKEDWLDAAQRAEMEFPVPQEVRPPMSQAGQRGYLVEAVRDYLTSHDIVDEARLNGGGLRIHTTIDRKKQQELVKAVEEQLYSQLSDEREVDRYVRAGATSIAPDTGRVVAMYGGVGYTEQYFNNATRADYQAASTFKPFVYAAALANDATTQGGQPIGPDTVYDGTSKRAVVSNGEPTDFKPQNESDKDYGDLPVSEAMDKSVNAVFAQMGVDVGPEKVKQTLVKAGIPENTGSLAEAGPSIALGTATPSTLDVAQAYATLAAHGERTDYRLVEKITRGDEEIPVPGPTSEQAIPRGAADATTAVLRGVVEGGTGTAAQSAGRPAAGKTGTAENDRAAWFAGYTPELVTVVAVMGQDPDSGAHKALYGAAGLEKMSGGGIPARIWGQYTAAALKGEPVRDFDLAAKTPKPAPSATSDPGSGSSGASGAPQEPEGDGAEPEPTGPKPTEVGASDGGSGDDGANRDREPTSGGTGGGGSTDGSTDGSGGADGGSTGGTGGSSGSSGSDGGAATGGTGGGDGGDTEPPGDGQTDEPGSGGGNGNGNTGGNGNSGNGNGGAQGSGSPADR
ncbi:transglycosylase domain-containing protein [Streptomyces sp. TRM 70351]|uniref:transglycosylase domain-containing protein n=1 Tax=Streptomyces sp. TRM 70351 TaxID=3116552 RepID=UPI002E7BF2C8|nr:transglycosylase domain-containing protein [Streptomyces sp. TRM 70351]MEE1928142.1 transglycosylase domain-containing protein [Streptomyces sp. TRM 70351]